MAILVLIALRGGLNLGRGAQAFGQEANSVRYLPTMVRRSGRETASSMGDTPCDSMHKLSRLAQSTRRLSSAEIMLAVVRSVAQLLDNGAVMGKYRSTLLAPSRECIGKRGMQAGMAPLWPHEPRGLSGDLRGLKHGVVGSVR